DSSEHAQLLVAELQMLARKAQALLESDRAAIGAVKHLDTALPESPLDQHLEGMLQGEEDRGLAALVVEVVEGGDHPSHRRDGLLLEHSRHSACHVTQRTASPRREREWLADLIGKAAALVRRLPTPGSVRPVWEAGDHPLGEVAGGRAARPRVRPSGERRGNEICQEGRLWTFVDAPALGQPEQPTRSISPVNKPNSPKKRRGRD